MDFKQYYRSLPRDKRELYAERVGTSVGYIETQLIGARKMPREELINSLALESDGVLNRDDLLLWFFHNHAKYKRAARKPKRETAFG